MKLESFLPVLILLLLALASPAGAASITVDTFNDVISNDGSCSLREAVISANDDVSVDTCTAGSGDDTIVLGAGEYVLETAGASEDASLTGDLDILNSVTIEGGGAAIVNADSLDRVFHVMNSVSAPDVSAVFNGITITGGSTPGDGGGVCVDSGTADITNSTISGNTSTSGGGGGVWVDSGGTANITGSTISGNSVSLGVLATAGGIGVSGTANITNSTISGNSVTGSSFSLGGGIAVSVSGTANITNSTISGNSATGGIMRGGGIYTGGAVNIGSSILSGNSAVTSGPDCYGTVGALTSQGYNLVNDLSSGGCTFGGTGDQTGVDAMLGPLQDNGGATLTHALLPGSQAIDTGDPACTGTDQRGFSRPLDGDSNGTTVCDIGSYEYGMVYMTLTASNIAFGSIEAGFSSGAQELTIQAHGPGSLQLNDIYLAGADQSDFTLDLNGGASPCGSTSLLLRQGGACTVTLTFSPGASPGAKSALLVLLSDSPVTGSLTVMLSGTGTPGPVPAIALSKNSLDFGTVDAAEFSEKTLTLTNNGTGDLTLGTINGSDPLGSPFSIVTDTCTGQSVPASGTCDITVRFKPATVSAAAHGIGGLGVIMLGMVMASGITRRRKALAVLLIGAVMAVSLLAACGGGDGGDTNDEGEGTSTYSDTFNVPSDDPDTPNITVNVSGSF